MRTLSFPEVLPALCRDAKLPGAYVAIANSVADDLEPDELRRAAPWFDLVRDGQLFFDLCGFLLFDSVEEMEAVFGVTVGDDGPTALNRYTGPVRVYMLTCGADGVLKNENT